VSAKLAELLIDLSEFSDEDAEQVTFDRYAELYLDRGTSPKRTGLQRAHDGERVIFFEDRFPHAFSETVSWYAKGPFDRSRGERVAWIGPVVSGEVPGTECWLVPPKNGGHRTDNRPRNRLYIVNDEGYVVWLEPLRAGGFKFSSAYVAGPGDLRRYRKTGRKLWAQKNTP
jgi:hypothetical protein